MCKRQRWSDLVALGSLAAQLEMPWGRGSWGLFPPTWYWLPGESTFQDWAPSDTLMRTNPTCLGHMVLVIWGIVFFKYYNISPLFVSYFIEAPGPSQAWLLSRRYIPLRSTGMRRLVLGSSRRTSLLGPGARGAHWNLVSLKLWGNSPCPKYILSLFIKFF